MALYDIGHVRGIIVLDSFDFKCAIVNSTIVTTNNLMNLDCSMLPSRIHNFIRVYMTKSMTVTNNVSFFLRIKGVSLYLNFAITSNNITIYLSFFLRFKFLIFILRV